MNHPVLVKDYQRVDASSLIMLGKSNITNGILSCNYCLDLLATMQLVIIVLYQEQFNMISLQNAT